MAIHSLPERPSTLSVIRSCSMLNVLDEKLVDKLVETCFMAHAERGQVIYVAGTRSQFVGIVGAGFIKLSRTSPHGAEVAVELLGPGQCFGLLSAIEGREYPLTAVAVAHTWYLKIPTTTFNEIYHQCDRLPDQALRTMSPRLRRAYSMMARLTSGKVEQRLAAVLLILIDCYGEDADEGTRIQVSLTRQDLAEMVGTTAETTIRIMTRWQKERLVLSKGQELTVLAPTKLEDMLNS